MRLHSVLDLRGHPDLNRDILSETGFQDRRSTGLCHGRMYANQSYPRLILKAFGLQACFRINLLKINGLISVENTAMKMSELKIG